MNTNGVARSPSSQQEFWRKAHADFDLPKFFEALPTDQFATLIDDIEERLAALRQSRERLAEEIAKLETQAATFRQALEIRQQVIEAREHERGAAAREKRVPALSPRRKRAEVVRVFENHPSALLTPADVRTVLARAGLIDPANETGTPVRILLAQLNEAGVLTRPSPGHYRYKTRDERATSATPGKK